jgi:hydroxyacylglutathione hydrolase
MNLEPISAFEDNYIWAIHNGQSALFVDPGEAAPILAWLEQRRLNPVAILVTHHHGDHCGGLREILDQYPIPVFGPAHERIRGVSITVSEGDICPIPELSLNFEVLDIPGHTPGHVAYLGRSWLFCGDTLFSCGCGKVFGGTVEQLHASLVRLSRLPAETLVCCAHEYTLDNIRFALTIDPDNTALLEWQKQALFLRHAGQPTLPVKLGDELRRNPFLRCHHSEIQNRLARLPQHSKLQNETQFFTTLREEKDRFG